MTREEAIKHLSEWMDEKMWMCFGTIDREAIGMAIEALLADVISRENCDQCKIDQVGVLEQQLAELRGDYETLKKAYEEALSAETDWIPCSERLPSEIGTIIVTLLDKKYGECFVDDEWWDGDMFLNFGKPTSGYEVIAWMPYPMPYRKGDER